MFGFLLGVTLAGSSAYYYVIDEYKLANDMLSEDIYVCPSPNETGGRETDNFQALQAAVQRLHDHITELENKAAQESSRK